MRHHEAADLRETLLLQVANDSISTQSTICNPELHIVEVPLVEGQLEQILRAIQALFMNLVLPIHAVHTLPVHSHNVQRIGQRMDNAAVSIRQAVLHMAQCGVDEDPILIPCPTLHPDVLMEGMVVLQVLPCQQHIVLGHEGPIGPVLGPNHIAHTTRNAQLIHCLSGSEVIHYHLLFTLQQNAIVATCWIWLMAEGQMPEARINNYHQLSNYICKHLIIFINTYNAK